MAKSLAYSERRRRITSDRSARDRIARKSLRRLREGGRKEDVIYKTARRVEKIAKRYNAAVVVGNAHRGKNRMASNANSKSLRHRIHQWCPLNAMRITEGIYLLMGFPLNGSLDDEYASDPSTMYRGLLFNTSTSFETGRRVKVLKIQMRLARLSNGLPWIEM